VQGGRSVDVSMGMTPLEGLVMGTRSGDVDLGAVLQIGKQQGWSLEQLEAVLTRESGLRGLCGDSDMRRILSRIEAGDGDATQALEIYAYRLRKYIGAYRAVLGGLDALVFTGGVGEHAPLVRALACAGLEHLGIYIDPSRNAAALGKDASIQDPAAPVATLVLCTDEEGEMARQAQAVIKSGPSH